MRTFSAIWGRRIRQARIAAGFTQERFAIAIGVDQANVSRWERGLASPKANRRPLIARVLGIDPDVLFSYSNGDIEAA